MKTREQKNSRKMRVGMGWVLAIGMILSSIQMPFAVQAEEKTQLAAEDEAEITDISLNLTSCILKPEETVQLEATVLPEEAADQELLWTSEDDSIAEVDEDGLVTAIDIGETTVSVTDTTNSVNATCTITVEKIAVTDINLNVTSQTMMPEEELQLEATVLPEDAMDTDLLWETNDDTVAEVDEDGLVTALAAGEATITVTDINGLAEATCDIVVEELEITEIKLNKASYTMKPGDEFLLEATILPEEAEDTELQWSSDDDTVAEVDEDGWVTAIGEGETIITVTDEAETVEASCEITVKNAVVAVTGVSLNKNKLTLLKGKSEILKASVLPKNATSKEITYTSSDYKIVSVDKKSGKLTARGAGTATITVKSTNGKKAVCKVIVPNVRLSTTTTSLQVNQKSTALEVKDVYPAGDKPISWKSSNPSIVKVNSKGVLTAQKKSGSAVITVTMKSGTKATCKVKVQMDKVVTKSLSISSKSLFLLKGKKATLTVVKNPITASEKITWKTSDSKVAAVDSKGRVTARGIGTATITAASSNGKKVSCKVTVPSVTLKENKTTVKVNKSYTLKIKSKLVKNDAIASCKSSNPKVATVDNKGKITGKKAGTANIKVIMKSGATAVCKVIVKK